MQLKKTILTAALLFSCAVLSFAQADTSRITGLLARMPAQNEADGTKNMEEIAALGKDGLVEMIARFAAQPASVAQVEYAIGGFSYYVMQPGRENWRAMAVRAYGEALEKFSTATGKSFMIRQLEITGNEEAVGYLQKYLADDSLCDPATRALVKIHTAHASAALLDALKPSTGHCRLSLIEALGDMRYKEAAKVLPTFLNGADKETRRAVWYALANIADPSSASLLKKAEDKEAYLLFIERTGSEAPYVLNKKERRQGYTLLFDGTNLDQWTGNKGDYVVENGMMALHPDNKGNGNLYTSKEFADFELRFEFKLTPGGNNGVGIRAPLRGDAAYVGMEIQILDNEADMYKDLHEYQYHGSVYGVIPAKRGFLKPTGEWNYEQIIARGNRITVILNGETILNGDIEEASRNGTLDKREHPGLKNKTGHIGFLWHETPIQFRHIRIKELQ